MKESGENIACILSVSKCLYTDVGQTKGTNKICEVKAENIEKNNIHLKDHRVPMQFFFFFVKCTFSDWKYYMNIIEN